MDVDVENLPFTQESFEKLKHEVQRLRMKEQDFLLIEKMKDAWGFIQMYFMQIKTSRTYVEAFNTLNEKYFDLTGEYRYSDYNSFQTQMRRTINKRKNENG